MCEYIALKYFISPSQGPVGAPGAKGNDGPVGVPGVEGLPGPKGIEGVAGNKVRRNEAFRVIGDRVKDQIC